MSRLAIALLVLALGCASPELARFPYCQAPRVPVVGAGECDAEQLAQLREAMRPVLEEEVGSGMVRVEFDADSAISQSGIMGR